MLARFSSAFAVDTYRKPSHTLRGEIMAQRHHLVTPRHVRRGGQSSFYHHDEKTVVGCRIRI